MSKIPTIRDLYPHLSEEELEIAEENFDRYLSLVTQIFKRLEAEGRIDEVLKSSRDRKGSSLKQIP